MIQLKDIRKGTQRLGFVGFASIALFALSGAAAAESQPEPPRAASTGSTGAVTVVVTARKWVEPLQADPSAVTVLSGEDIDDAGIRTVRDASRFVPNLTLSDFTARRLSFPFMRGIGSGRNSPAVATCIDGVPQLSYATANQELLDVERIEFLRGPQGSLYGRNALAGVVNVVPRLPPAQPAADVSLTGGNFGLFDGRVSAGGPLGAQGLLAGVAAGYATRDGYTKNELTGHRLDDREAVFGRGQVVWPEAGPWSFRLSAGGERDRDGDYALGDLSAIRANPHHVQHDFEGRTDRDLAQPVFTAARRGEQADFASVTAFQWWRSHDVTDLDESPADLIRRDNEEQQQAWIEELRWSSPADAPLALGPKGTLRWLLGTFAFRSDYRQNAVNEFRPAAVPLLGIPVPYRQLDDANLKDDGVSLFGQTSWTWDERLEIALGLRHDYEHKSADLLSRTDPLLAAPATLDADRDFSETSPRVTLAYHFTPDAQVYAGASQGYKTGGFNAQATPEHASFDEETSWTYETGVKTTWFRQRVMANAALFRTDWDNLQLDVPGSAPGAFFIDNAGKARSRGAELELTIRPLTGLDLFGGLGLLDTEFRPGSASGGADVGGNDLPFAPRTTWHAGAEYSQPIRDLLRAFVRVDGFGSGRYFYDAVNGAEQDTYALANARLGVGTEAWRIEGWVNNVFDQDYVPVAFPSPLAPSGYFGENGAPRTFGVSYRRAF
jgi:iron complex outermembrane recepter protein